MVFIIDLENNKLIIKDNNKKINSSEYEQIDISDKQLKERVLKIINTYGGQNEPKGNDNGRPI